MGAPLGTTLQFSTHLINSISSWQRPWGQILQVAADEVDSHDKNSYIGSQVTISTVDAAHDESQLSEKARGKKRTREHFAGL
jgi:hypothetical protein